MLLTVDLTNVPSVHSLRKEITIKVQGGRFYLKDPPQLQTITNITSYWALVTNVNDILVLKSRYQTCLLEGEALDLL
jgi:hypothetical protein